MANWLERHVFHLADRITESKPAPKPGRAMAANAPGERNPLTLNFTSSDMRILRAAAESKGWGVSLWLQETALPIARRQLGED